MPLTSYGVLVGRAVDARREGGTDAPHYQIRLVDADGVSYRIAVNVRSQEYPSELLYRVDDDFRHPVAAQLTGLVSGWHLLDDGPAGVNLDYVRQTLFDRTLLRPLPGDVAGPGNDLSDLLDDQIQRAIREPAAVVYAFGERWGPENGVPDKIFGFGPGNGVHDIHMNQGNVGTFRKDDGVWQDGALIIALPDQQRWSASSLPSRVSPGTPTTRPGTPWPTRRSRTSVPNRSGSSPPSSIRKAPRRKPRRSRC